MRYARQNIYRQACSIIIIVKQRKLSPTITTRGDSAHHSPSCACEEYLASTGRARAQTTTAAKTATAPRIVPRRILGEREKKKRNVRRSIGRSITRALLLSHTHHIRPVRGCIAARSFCFIDIQKRIIPTQRSMHPSITRHPLPVSLSLSPSLSFQLPVVFSMQLPGPPSSRTEKKETDISAVAAAAAAALGSLGARDRSCRITTLAPALEHRACKHSAAAVSRAKDGQGMEAVV